MQLVCANVNISLIECIIALVLRLGGKFVGILKKTWVHLAAYMELNEGNQAIDLFQKLEKTCMFSSQLNNGELPLEVEGLEQFVRVFVYCATGPNTLPEPR